MRARSRSKRGEGRGTFIVVGFIAGFAVAGAPSVAELASGHGHSASRQLLVVVIDPPDLTFEANGPLRTLSRSFLGPCDQGTTCWDDVLVLPSAGGRGSTGSARAADPVRSRTLSRRGALT